DTSGITSFGDANSVVEVDPNQKFSDFVQKFLKRKSAKLWFQRGTVYLDRIDDGIYTVLDDTADELFNPHDLTLTPIDSAVRNDLTGIGDIEAQAYCKEYYIADGITTHYPLKLPMFGTDGNPILQDQFDEDTFDDRKWLASDPSGAFVF